VLIAPTGSTTNPPPYYWWYDVGDTSWYYLWVNDSSGTPVIRQWYTSAQANCTGKWCWVTDQTASLQADTYTWWIRGWNSCGYGPWSAGMDFTVPSPDLREPAPASIAVQKGGTGTGTILIGAQVCGPDCPGMVVPYLPGSRYPVQAIPAADARFEGWQTEDGEPVEDALFYAHPGETIYAIFERQ
jgi:hypothetical protein